MNSEVIVLLSSISTGVLALFALCIKFSILSKCSKVSFCWHCIEWNKPETKDEPMPQIPNTPSNNNLFNNISNV
jgi:hypothetical protein